MRKATLAGLAGLVGAGLISVPVTSAASGDDAAILKRDDQVNDLVLVDDDDDDDDLRRDNTNTGTNTGKDTNTDKDTNSQTRGASANTADSTRSNFTKVSRDRDLSRGDKTRDWTRDGKGGKKRDHSANRTNDRSRNDSRR